jgi:hypothetical protein
MKATEFIQTEMQRRLDLINDEQFRVKSVEMAKQLGITAKEWNDNKSALLMYFANEFCKLENRA